MEMCIGLLYNKQHMLLFVRYSEIKDTMLQSILSSTIVEFLMVASNAIAQWQIRWS